MASESDTDDAVLPERRRSRVVWKVDLPSLLNLIFAYKRGASVTFDEVKTALVEYITNEPKPISKAVRNVTERNLIYALITEFPKMRFKPKEKLIRNLEILSKRKKSSEVGIRRNFYETTDTAEKRRSRHLSFQENDLGVISQGQLLSPFSDNASTAGSDCTEAAFSRNLDVAELFGEGKIDSWFSDVPTDLDYVNSWLSLSNTPAPSTIPDNTSEPIGIATENTISIKADRSANTGLNLDSLKLPNSTKHNLKAIEEPLHNLQPRFKAPETPDIVITEDSIDQTSEAQLQSSAPRMRKQGLYSNVNKIEEQKNILNENEKQNGLIGNKKASSSKDESSNCESNDTKKEEKTHKLGETDPENKTESKNAPKFPSKSSKVSDRFGAFSKKLEETKPENDQKPLKTLKKTSIANSSIADKFTKEAQNNRNEAEKTETKSEKTETKSEKTTETSSQNKNTTAKNTKESEVTSAPNNNAAQDDSAKNQIKMNQLSSKENAEKNKINTTEAGRGIVGTNKKTSDDKNSTGVNKKIESVMKKEKEKSSAEDKKQSQKLTKTDEKLGVNQNNVTKGNSGSTATKAEKIGEKLETNSSDPENVIGMKINHVQTNVSQAENSVESASEILDTRAQRRKERELKDAQRRAEKEKLTSGKNRENENESSQAPNSATRNEDSKSSSFENAPEKEISSSTLKLTEAKKPIENAPNDSKTEKQSNSTAEVLDTKAQRRNDRARRDGKQNEKTNQATENETKSESAAKESSESNSTVDKKIGSTQAKSRENDSNDKKIETKKPSANDLDPKAQRQNNRTQRDERGYKKRDEKEKDSSENKTVDKSFSHNLRPEKAVKSETEPLTDDKNSASESQEKEESAPRKAARERFERNRTEKQKARDQKLATEPKSQNGDTDKDEKTSSVLNEKSDDPETVKKKEREKELRRKRLEDEEEQFLEELRKKKTAEEKRKKEEQQKKESQRMIIVGLFILLLVVTFLIQTNKNH